jgi:hypothetical protein
LTSPKRRLVDVGLGVLLVYVSLWVYELGNLLSLSALGNPANLTIAGIFPIGVSALVRDTQWLSVAKALQICFSALVIFAIFTSVRSRQLPISRTLALTTLSLCLASGYWEVLSLVGPLSYTVHVGIFASLAILAQLGLSRVLHV